VELDEDDEDDENAIEWPINLVPLIWDAEMWLTLKGAAYWLELRKGNQLTDLRTLNANTMRVKTWDNDGPLTFEQKIGSRANIYPADEIVYFRTFDPHGDIREGVAMGGVGQQPGQLIYNANRWAAKFFENGAIPAVMLTTEGAVPPGEKDRIQNVWEKMLQGVQKAFKTVVLEKGLTPTVIGQPIQDMAMPDLETLKRNQILAAHQIPPGLGDVKTNRAERDALQLEFWKFWMIPYMQTRIVPVLDKQLFNPLNLRISFHYNEIEALQKEEIAKAEAAAFYVSGVASKAYEDNVISLDEYRAVVNRVLVMGDMPALSPSFTPEERMPVAIAPAKPGSSDEGGMGSPGDIAENIENRASPKALAPEWGRHRVYLQS
jgi:phage portal protein BeeE